MISSTPSIILLIEKGPLENDSGCHRLQCCMSVQYHCTSTNTHPETLFGGAVDHMHGEAISQTAGTNMDTRSGWLFPLLHEFYAHSSVQLWLDVRLFMTQLLFHNNAWSDL